MGKWVDIKGPVVADTVYSDNVLVAKDTSFTLPGIEFLTADVQAMGTMTVPLIGLLENMELTVTKIGVDNGLSRLNRLEKQNLEFRCYQLGRLPVNRGLQGVRADAAEQYPGDRRGGRKRDRDRSDLQRHAPANLRERSRGFVR